jgi:hypothetical protein
VPHTLFWRTLCAAHYTRCTPVLDTIICFSTKTLSRAQGNKKFSPRVPDRPLKKILSWEMSDTCPPQSHSEGAAISKSAGLATEFFSGNNRRVWALCSFGVLYLMYRTGRAMWTFEKTPNHDTQKDGSRAAPGGGGTAATLDDSLPPHIMALAMGQAEIPDPLNSREEYRSRVAQVIPAEVRMISGYKDAQTSADVESSAGYSLPADAGPGGAGGACTNAILEIMNRMPNMSWKDLFMDMRVVLAIKRFEQVPQFSASKEMSLSTPFVLKKSGQGRTRALFIGINYVGHTPGELKGCHDDVEKMQRFVLKQGFDEANMKFLMDDGKNVPPNCC